MMKIRLSVLSVCVGAALSTPVQAITLWDAYLLALKNDPAYKVALADYKAGQLEGNIALAALLPQLSLSFFQGEAQANRTQNTIAGPRTDVTDYSVKNNQLQLRQTIINKGAWARLNQGNLLEDISKIKGIQGRNDVALRVVKAYFNAVSVLDQVELAKAQEKAAVERFNEMESGFKKGENSRTELARARAQRDLRSAERLEIQDNLDIAIRQLEDLIGQRVKSLDLLPSVAESPPIQSPDNYPTLEEYALQNNPQVLSSALEVQLAEEEIKRRDAGHYPVLDLIANKVDSDSESINTIGLKTKQDLVALQLQVPLFAGFGVINDTNKARAQRERSEAVWQGTLFDILNKLRTQYSRTQNATSKIDAYARAVDSAKEALKAAELAKKFELQIRSDVLVAQAELNNAEKEYSRIRYESYTSLIELNSLAGKLQNSDLQRLSDFIAAKGKRIAFERQTLPKYEYQDPRKFSGFSAKLVEPSDPADFVIPPSKSETQSNAQPQLTREESGDGSVSYRLQNPQAVDSRPPALLNNETKSDTAGRVSVRASH